MQIAAGRAVVRVAQDIVPGSASGVGRPARIEPVRPAAGTRQESRADLARHDRVSHPAAPMRGRLVDIVV